MYVWWYTHIIMYAAATTNKRRNIDKHPHTAIHTIFGFTAAGFILVCSTATSFTFTKNGFN